MRYGFVIDQNRCIGCHACTVACKEEHDVPIGVNRTWVKYIEKGIFPETNRHFAVLRCNHCDDAPCITICPTNALFRTDNGIVDFDSDNCVGCKSCMQACPYDALYIDPNTNTAAKCNFCAHRIEVDLKPACEVVCPVNAIISGDLDDVSSRIFQIISKDKVTVRKPEKGTHPKLAYVGVEGDLLHPSRIEKQESYHWGEVQKPKVKLADPSIQEIIKNGTIADKAREVYDVAHPRLWGRAISTYLWTKSIGAGALLVSSVLLLFGLVDNSGSDFIDFVGPIIALGFIGITMVLLVLDLKRPERFFYLLTKPNLKSWLVLGSYVLMVYGALASAWFLFGQFESMRIVQLSLTGLFAAAAAGYTAFLFAQAKGRDLWQSPLLLWHLIVQAFIAGSASLMMASIFFASGNILDTLCWVLGISLGINAVMILSELFLTPHSEDVKHATDLLKRGALSKLFWGGAMLLGIVAPFVLFAVSNALPEYATELKVIAAALAIVGMWIFEDLWVKAGQAPPLS